MHHGWTIEIVVLFDQHQCIEHVKQDSFNRHGTFPKNKV
jgi:hypothetical protein